MGGSTISTVLAGVGGFIAGGPLGAALAVTSSVYQQSQARRARRRIEGQLAALRDRSLGQEIRVSGSGQGLDIHYGQTSTTGVQVFADTFNDYTSATTAGEMTVGTLASGTGSKNEYLLLQHALGLSGITAFRGLQIQEANSTNPSYAGSFISSVLSNTGTVGIPNAIASTNSTRRDGGARFTGLSYATSVFRLNRENPQYFGIPPLRFFIRGKAIYNPNSNDQVATDSSTWAYSPNPAYVLLDYLRHYVGIPLERIDLASFRTAGARADASYRGASPVSGIINAPSTTRNIRRYEFNGSLSTLSSFADNIETILNTMPGSIFVYGVDGMFKLAVPDTTTDNIVHTFNEDDLTSQITTVYPDTNNRLNQVTVVFPNASKDFAEDTLTFPSEGSTRHNGYLAADNNINLTQSVSRLGVATHYHARYLAAQLIEESRLPTYRFETRLRGMLFEPGDVVRLNNAQQGFNNTVVRILQVDAQDNVTLRFTAVAYNRNIYAAETIADETVRVAPDFDFTIAPPTDVTAEINIIADGIDTVTLSWTAADDIAVNNYIIEAGDGASPSTFTEVGQSFGETSYVFRPGAAGIYSLRVRSVTANDRVSAAVRADPPSVGLDLAVEAGALPLDDETIATDEDGNIIVQTIPNGGITRTPSGIGVNVDGNTVVVNNGQLEVPAVSVTINTANFTGGQTARVFNTQTLPYVSTGSVLAGNFRSYFEAATFFWRYDMNAIGQAQYQNLTGITLENFDASVSVINSSPRVTGNIPPATFDLTYFTGSGTTTGFAAESTFDGRLHFTAVPERTDSSTTPTVTRSGTFSTIGTQFPAPTGNNRYLFLGWRLRTDDLNLTHSTDARSYNVTFQAQSDTRLVLHFENGATRTETFNNFFV